MWLIWFSIVMKLTVAFKTIVIHHGRTTGIFQLDTQEIENVSFANNGSIEDIGMADYIFQEKNGTINADIRTQDILFCNLTVIDGDPKTSLLGRLGALYPVAELDFASMLSAVSACDNASTSTFLSSFSSTTTTTTTTSAAPYWGIFSGLGSLVSGSLWSGIVPDTKWCGINDIAEDYQDLGHDWQLDRCCRQHDHCPLKVKAFSKKFGLYNLLSPYTKSHCDCDSIFYDCLKAAGTEKANKIGRVFFNVLNMQCMELGLPPVCQEYQYFRVNATEHEENVITQCAQQKEEDSTNNSSLDDSTTNNSLGEDSTHNAEIEDSTHNTSVEDSTHNASIEDSTANASVEDSTHNSLLENSTHNSLVEDSTHNASVEDSTRNSSLENSVEYNKTVDIECGRTRKCLKWIPDVTKQPRLMFVKKKRSF